MLVRLLFWRMMEIPKSRFLSSRSIELPAPPLFLLLPYFGLTLLWWVNLIYLHLLFCRLEEQN